MRRLDYLLQDLRIRAAAPWLKHGDSVLDIGCHDGALARKFPKLSAYVGIDPELPAGIENAAGKKFIRGRFPGDLPGDRPFDAITALAIFEHIARPDHDLFARACHQKLRNGGRLILTIPSSFADPVIELLIRCRLLDGMDFDHHTSFDVAETPRIFERNGFRMVHHETFELGLNHLYVFESTRAQ